MPLGSAARTATQMGGTSPAQSVARPAKSAALPTARRTGSLHEATSALRSAATCAPVLPVRASTYAALQRLSGCSRASSAARVRSGHSAPSSEQTSTSVSKSEAPTPTSEAT